MVDGCDGGRKFAVRILLACTFACYFVPVVSLSQSLPKENKINDTRNIPQPRNIKILEEHQDTKGNTVRTIRYDQGRDQITETVVIPPKMNINRIPVNPDTLHKDSLLLVVNKSKYNLEVYYRRKLIRSYKAVFGPKPMENKVLAGDRCTPEGWYTIKTRNP